MMPLYWLVQTVWSRQMQSAPQRLAAEHRQTRLATMVAGKKRRDVRVMKCILRCFGLCIDGWWRGQQRELMGFDRKVGFGAKQPEK